MLRGLGAVAGFTFAAAALLAQTPSPTPSPAPAAATTPTPNPNASETPLVTPSAASAGEAPPEAPPITPNAAPVDTRALIDEIGGCVESGKLNVEVDLLEGSVPVVQKWTVVTKGSPLAKMSAQAAGGRIERLNFDVSNGTLLVSGKGLRPKVYVESVAFQDGKGITDAKFHGKGIWRPIVGIFRGIAMSALRKLQFRTDIPSVLRGDVLGSSSSKPTAVKTPTPGPALAAAPTPTPGPSFLDLVREARVHDSEFVAYGEKPLGMGDLVRFQTAAAPKGGVPLKVTLDKGSYIPGRDGAPAQIDASGALEGEIENGAVGFGESHSTFSSGELRGGKFHIRTLESGKFGAQIGASSFSVELNSGEFHLPGGTEVDAAAPSRIAFRDLKVEEDGSYSAVLDADLTGKVGRIARAGTTVSLASVHART
ncbi:MAG TPA: hypothetical protein VKE50_03215, partial [Thermoanaerobaculia bacterium]|nr:hypothetical protein [Thermoanaerobaculia bacterium]